MTLAPTKAFYKTHESFFTFLEKETSQKLTPEEQIEIKNIILKIHCQLGGNIPSETVTLSPKENKESTWNIRFYSDNYQSVYADIYQSSNTSCEHKTPKLTKILVVEHSLEQILEHAPLITIYEASLIIKQCNMNLGLFEALNPIKMLESAIEYNFAGSLMDVTSPYCVYNEKDGVFMVSYEHITSQHPTVVIRKYYRVIKEIPVYPTLSDYSQSNLVINRGNRQDMTSGFILANDIDGLFSLISGYFPVNIDSLLWSLKELLYKNKSSNGLFKLHGYSVPVFCYDYQEYWAVSFPKIVLAKELVEEIFLFNTDIPLSTKGEIIEEIAGISPEPTFLTEITNAVNQVFHSTRTEVGGITMRYSKTTGNVIIVTECLNDEYVIKVFRVNEKGIKIGTNPTLKDFLGVTNYDLEECVILNSICDLIRICKDYDIDDIHPFVKMMTSNTVSVSDTVFKVMPSYHPTVQISSPKGTYLYKLTKDLIEKLYKIEKCSLEMFSNEIKKFFSLPFDIKEGISMFILKTSYLLKTDPHLFLNALKASNFGSVTVKSIDGLDITFNLNSETKVLNIDQNGATVLEQKFPVDEWTDFINKGF